MERDWQTLPDWLPEGTFLRNPIKVHWPGRTMMRNYLAWETRHRSDGWVVRVSRYYARFWNEGWWEYAAYFEPGWEDEDSEND